jgi:hypothetical protein
VSDPPSLNLRAVVSSPPLPPPTATPQVSVTASVALKVSRPPLLQVEEILPKERAEEGEEEEEEEAVPAADARGVSRVSSSV